MSEQQPFKLKALEWRQDGGDGFRCFSAETAVGRFAYGTDRDGKPWHQAPHEEYEHPTEEAARLAAERAHRARVQDRARELCILPTLGGAFQDRVKPWMMTCFGPEISGDKLERGDRVLEEVLELLQSGDYPRERVAALTDYVWSRPAGEPAQEVGGAMVTLAAYCLAHGLDMHAAGETELARIWTKVDKIRAKQAAKPTGSALPIATPPARAEPAVRALEAELDALYAGPQPARSARGGDR